MFTQQASSAGVHHAAEVVDLTIAAARRAGRHDLVRRLSDARRLLVDPTVEIGPAHLRVVTNHTLSALDQLQQTLRSRRSALTRPGRADAARAQARLADDQLDSLYSRSA